MPSIARLPISNKYKTGTEIDPYPILPALISANGKWLLYDCSWCGKRHRHTLKYAHFRDGVTLKQTHCAIWRRLFKRPRFAGGDHVLLSLADGSGLARTV